MYCKYYNNLFEHTLTIQDKVCQLVMGNNCYCFLNIAPGKWLPLHFTHSSRRWTKALITRCSMSKGISCKASSIRSLRSANVWGHVAQSISYRVGTSDHYGWYAAKEQGDIPNAKACLTAEWRGLWMSAWRASSTRTGVHCDLGRPGLFSLRLDAVVRKWLTHLTIVQWSGTLSWRPSLKWRWKILWTVIGDSLFFK